MKKILLSLLAMLFVACNSTTSETLKPATSDEIQKIEIPFRDNYSQMPSVVINNKEAFEKFLLTIANKPSWNHKTELLTALQDADIDFKKYNLIIYRITEVSGSIKLTVGDALISNKHIVVPIKRYVPSIGTDDMAYYALAYLVRKDIVDVTFDNHVQKVVVANKATDMVVPTNCKAWNDGCNDCGRTSPDNAVACTTRACLVYAPENFVCREWE